MADVPLTVPAGPVCGFLGPNGAGKTATMRLLATLTAPTAAVAAAAVLAAGVGSVFPRFEAVDFGGARAAVSPSKVAYSVFSTSLS